MPSAPAGGALSPSPRRRAVSASPARARRSPGRRSAPARLGASPKPMRRRALSAPPGARTWSPPRTRRVRRGRGGVSSVAKAVTGILALQGVMKGNTPYVGASGKSLAVWPLGSSGPNYLAQTRTMGRRHELAKYPVVERASVRRPKTCGRKACLGGQPNSSLYDPKMTWVKLNGGGMPRKFGEGAYANFPQPVISAANVLKFEAQGYQLPKTVLRQAHAGLPIIGNYKLSNKTKAALLAKNPRMLPALLKAQKSPASRFNRTGQLALPPSVQRKLAALEARGRAGAVSGTAKALAAPWKVAAKARNLTGRAAASVGRGVSYAASLPGRGRRSLMRVLTAQERRLPN